MNLPLNKTVCFFTDDTEVSFVNSEIKMLASCFERVEVYCFNEGEPGIDTPNVFYNKLSFHDYKFLETLRGYSVLFFSALLSELFGSPNYFRQPKDIRKLVSELARSIYLSKLIHSKQRNAGTNVYLSYWFNQWATALSILVRKKKIIHAFSRVHGADLYEERVPVIQKLPFRRFQLKNMTKVFSVSQKGSVYLWNKYPEFKHKVFTSRLGTHDHGINPFNLDAKFTIVSCATIRNIKRIHLLAEIVKYVEFPIQWIHIGSESKNDPTLPILREKISGLKVNKPDLEIKFVGALKNEDVFKLYSSESINLFVSVSETEGLPVSMMEAISFGIPVMSTDVGGCSEIVNEQTGFLIRKEFDPAMAALEIEKFRTSQKNNQIFRKGVRAFWEENFEINRNFKAFVDSIIN